MAGLNDLGGVRKVTPHEEVDIRRFLALEEVHGFLLVKKDFLTLLKSTPGLANCKGSEDRSRRRRLRRESNPQHPGGVVCPLPTEPDVRPEVGVEPTTHPAEAGPLCPLAYRGPASSAEGNTQEVENCLPVKRHTRTSRPLGFPLLSGLSCGKVVSRTNSKGSNVLEGLSLDVWRERLEAGGHVVQSTEESGHPSFRLWPRPDTIVTVAVEPDVTLKPQYRQRYFLCECNAERVFRLVGCPPAHWSRWQELLAQQPEGYWHDFLAGPGAWTLARLARFPEVTAWAERGLDWPGLDNQHHRDWGMSVPARAGPLFPPGDSAPAYQPCGFSTADERFPDAVAACFLFASVALRDCYLADAAGSEVYLAHHHDKVVISIPDSVARKDLVQEITDATWLFQDVSGYDEDDE